MSLPQLYAALSLDPAQVVRQVAARRQLAGSRARIVIGSLRAPADVTAALAEPADIVTVPPAVLAPWLASPASQAIAAQFAADARGLTA